MSGLVLGWVFDFAFKVMRFLLNEEVFTCLYCHVFTADMLFLGSLMVRQSSFILLLLLASFSVYSQENVKVSALDNSRWAFSGDNTLCSIEHEIKGFGIAKLIAEAGEELRLELKSNEITNLTVLHSVYEISPVWKSNNAKFIDSLGDANNSNATGEIIVNKAGAIFERLKSGSWIKVIINAGRQLNDEIVLSNINFEAPAEAFVACRNSLIPVNYQQIRNNVFYFDSGSSDVSKNSHRTLMGIAEFVSATQSISKILVDGYSDSQGRTGVKLRMSRERAEEVASLLIEYGIPRSMLQIRSHGDRYPVEDNAEAAGRQKNRRVSVRLIKKSVVGRS
ncbi:OmpA family protein [Photobacterium alginatilyticum]